jgi:hypothetical protein
MGKQRSKEGFIYIISNSNFPNYYKIGVTENIAARLRTYQTSSPYRDYAVEYYVKHQDCYKAEQKIRENMRYFATDIKNEWYRVDLGVAKARLDETLQEEENILP